MVLITVSGRKEVIMATVPLRVSNRLGFPMLEVQSITEATLPATITSFNFNNHPQRNINFFGGFFVKIPQNTTTLTKTNTVEFATLGINGSNLPLLKLDGTNVLVSDLSTNGGGIILCFYDKASNKLQVIGNF